MTRYRSRVAVLLTTGAGLLFAVPTEAAWQNNAPFGAALSGDLYTPNTVGESPAVLVAIHYCTGSSSSAHGWFDSYAEQHGFYIIAPNAGKQCFDSSISRSGDPQAIVDMVDYVLTQTGAASDRVFAAGLSSGGCMTNTLLAIYPDVFAGGAAMPGFTAGGWPAGDTTCTRCGTSPPSTDGAYWGDMARAVFSWSGTRPCVQQWVGGGDEYNFNGWLPAVAAQFQNLGNLGSGTPGTGAPSGWTRTEYSDAEGNVRLQTNLGPASQAHDLTGANLWGQVVSFLGLDQPTGACGIADTGTGGSGGTGGSAGAAGFAGAGGDDTGGGPGTGGTGSGGLPGSGGTGSGGLSGVGGTGSGGLPGVGGTGSGGLPGVGGTASGGVPGAGGTVVPGAGGTVVPGAGGTVVPGAGGTVVPGAGGTSSGGDAPMGTAGGAGASANMVYGSGDDGGCGCHAAGRKEAPGLLWSLGLLGAAFASRRRRQRKAS